MNFKTLGIFLLLLASSFTLVAQKKIVGKVIDKAGVLPGVNIYITNANQRVLYGVITDFNGDYVIDVPNEPNITVNFSFIGYQNHKVKYAGQKVLNVTLLEEMQQLDEVTVTHQAVERGSTGIPVKDQGVSSQKIGLDDMSDMAVSSVEEMLQGRMANVDMISTSGDPGSGMSIRIRGTSSLSASSEPLIVIDGIPQQMDIDDNFDFSTADAEDFGALVSISPSDIASIEVLKDAAATAIWGSRGGNGVLLITTKKGTIGKTRFTISEKMNVNFDPEPIERLNGFQYVSLIQEALWNKAYETNVGNNLGNLGNQQLVFDPNYIYNKEFNQDTDWLDEITRLGLSSETNFSMAGGGERATYRFSLGYLTEQGTTIGSDFKRLNARINVNYKFSKKLRIDAGVSFSDGRKGSPYSDETRSHAIKKMPNMSPYVIADDGARTDIYFTPESTIQGKWGAVFNPVAMANESYKNLNSRATNINFALNYNILKSLQYTGELGISVNNSVTKSFLPHSATGVPRLNENYNLMKNNSQGKLGLNINNKLVYNWFINNDHKIIASGIMQINDQSNTANGTNASALGSEDLGLTSTGIVRDMTGSNTGMREVGLVGSLHYNYKSRYMLTGTYRHEGNSRMSRDNRWAGFPSVAATWRLTNEMFMQRYSTYVDDFSFRASWGMSGNAPSGSFPYVGTFNVLSNYGDQGAVAPQSIHLNGLEWEEVHQTNFGFDAAFLKSKVRITFDYYNKETRNLLQRNVTIPSSTGFNKVPYLNSGVMRNRGWEFRIETPNIVKRNDFTLSFNFNASKNINTVLELPDNIEYTNYGEKAQNGKYAVTINEGHPLGAFYGFNCLGVYKDTDATYVRDASGALVTDIAGNPVKMLHEDLVVSPGDAIYKDINGDGSINRYDIVYLGNGMPEFTGGLGIVMSYKGFRLNTFFNARMGFDIINEARMKTENMYSYDNQSTAVLNRWRHEGDVTSIPRALHGRGYNWLGSDRFVEDGSFIRLQQLTLNYTLPKKLIQKLNFYKINCFVTAYNLFTWTNYSGQDPEISIKGGVYGGMGVDKGLTPRPKRVALGLNLEF